MSTNLTPRDQEIAEVFGGARGAIRSTLEAQYLVPLEDAQEIEVSLYEWFSRFSRRPGTPPSAATLRPTLFKMTCKAAQDYWLWKHHGGRITDDSIRFALNRDPEEIAIELEIGMKKTDGDLP